MEGLGICGEPLTEDNAAIDLPWPLNPGYMAVAKARVEIDKMRGRFGSVHRELGKARLHGPPFSALQEHSANTQALMLRINPELMGCCHAGPSEVLAFILCVRRLSHDRSDQLRLGRNHEAMAAPNALSSYIGRL